MTKKSRYKSKAGKHIIEVKVKNAQQLFDAKDPAPFRERDLDDDFVEYIETSAKELRRSEALKLSIQVEDCDSNLLSKGAIIDAIHEYYRYRVEFQTAELKTFLKRSQIYFVIGLVLLVLCNVGAQSLAKNLSSPLINGLKEGLIIFGWVSMWKPIELFLFDWYPFYEKRKLYLQLSKTEVEVQIMKTTIP